MIILLFIDDVIIIGLVSEKLYIQETLIALMVKTMPSCSISLSPIH
jgi:hypothetical protein